MRNFFPFGYGVECQGVSRITYADECPTYIGRFSSEERDVKVSRGHRVGFPGLLNGNNGVVWCDRESIPTELSMYQIDSADGAGKILYCPDCEELVNRNEEEDLAYLVIPNKDSRFFFKGGDAKVGIQIAKSKACLNGCRFCLGADNNDAFLGEHGNVSQIHGIYHPYFYSTRIKQLFEEADKNNATVDELVFTGLQGEPLFNFRELKFVLAAVRQEFGFGTEWNLPIRLNTNGQALFAVRENQIDPKTLESCCGNISEAAAEELVKAGLTRIAISMNAVAPERYLALCQPTKKEKAYPSVIAFAQACHKRGIQVQFSFVDYREYEQGLGWPPFDEKDIVKFAKDVLQLSSEITDEEILKRYVIIRPYMTNKQKLTEKALAG